MDTYGFKYLREDLADLSTKQLMIVQEVIEELLKERLMKLVEEYENEQHQADDDMYFIEIQEGMDYEH